MFAAATLAGPQGVGPADPALDATASSKMGFALSGASTIACLLFLSAFALGRKHGSRYCMLRVAYFPRRGFVDTDAGITQPPLDLI